MLLFRSGSHPRGFIRVIRVPFLYLLLLSASLHAADLPPGCLARLGDTRFRHPGPVTSLAFAPDGKTLVSHADGERAARVWAVPAGELVGKVNEPRFTRDITRVIGFAAGGKRLVLTNDDDEAITLELGVRNTEVTRWAARQVLALSGDGSLAAGADTLGRASVWRTDTGEKLLAVGNVPERKKLAAAFAPDGRRVAFAGHDAGAVQLYSLDRPDQPVTVPTVGTPTQLDWPAADRLLVRLALADGPAQLTALDPTTGKFGKTATDHPGPAVMFPDGVRRAAVSADTVLAEELVPVPKLLWSDSRRGAGVTGLAVSADGKLLATAVGTGVRLYAADTGAALLPDGSGLRPTDFLALSADGRRVLAAGDRTVTLWDADAGRPLHAWGEADLPAVVTGAELSPDGRLAAAVTEPDAGGGMTLCVWDTTNGRRVYMDRLNGPALRLLGFDAAGRVWTNVSDGAGVRVTDFAAGTPTVRVPKTEPPGVQHGSLSLDGRHVVANGIGVLAVRSADPAGPWRSFRPSGAWGNMELGRAVVSPTGGHVAVGWDRGLLGWPVRGPGQGVIVRDLLPAAADRLQGLAFTADGRQLAWTKANDTAVRFWDVRVWAERFRFEPPGGVKAFAFSRDGRRTAFAHPDGTLSVWDGVRALEDRSVPTDERFTDGEVWDKLGSTDARVGLVAVRTLASRPGVAVPLLAARLPVAEPGRVARLVADLDSPAYPVRESASRKLSGLGEVAEGAVRAAVENTLSPEVRVRAAAVLRQYHTPDGRLPPALLRAARAVEALERIGTPEAAVLLRTWAAADPTSLRATEAAAALGRMGK